MMRPSIILRVTQRWLVPMLIMVSFFLLLRGHDEPGGGFTGGLMAAVAVILVTLSRHPEAGRRLLRVSPTTFIAMGMALALASGLIGPITGKAFLTSVWLKADLGLFVFKAGTPLLFDMGVYLVVVGAVSTFALKIEDAPSPASDRQGTESAHDETRTGEAPWNS